MIGTGRKRLTEPLESVTAVFGLLLLIAAAASVAFSLFGSPSVDVLGTRTVCVTQPGTQYADSGWRMAASEATAKPGSSISVNGTLLACTTHATIGERVLYAVAQLAIVLFWACVLLLLWRMIVLARRTGPFTPAVARAMRRLGWFVIGGSLVASVVHLLATDMLLVSMVRFPNPFVNLIFLPVRDMVPVPILAGAALITFARIIRVGAAMDDELQGTI
jgi:hypothetical protein